MADMHVIDGDVNGKVKVVMHFDFPDTLNAAGVSYRTALVRAAMASVSVLPDGDGTGGTIDAVEKASLAAGAIIEHIEAFEVETAGVTVALIRAALRSRYARESTRVVAELQKRLRYYGRNEARA